MPVLKTMMLVLVLAFAVITSSTAFAHSVEDLGSMLGGREKCFQAMDREAPGFTLQTAEGRAFSLADLRGNVVVLHFVYANCPDVCPLHADRIAEVQEMVNRTPMKEQVRFVTITTDPVNDTDAVMEDYGPAHGLNPVNWTFLTTAPDQPEDVTRRLAEAYGHKFSKTGDGYQVHGVVTHVVDKQGRWRGNFHGLRYRPTNLVVFINALVNDAAVPHAHPEQSLWDRIEGWF
jgi:protein SCO1/2